MNYNSNITENVRRRPYKTQPHYAA